jgi:tRNA A37 threonylcarbamoyltransferase TsaD
MTRPGNAKRSFSTTPSATHHRSPRAAGDPQVSFLHPKISDVSDFSFSGFKTAALRHIERSASAPTTRAKGDEEDTEFVASYQQVIVDTSSPRRARLRNGTIRDPSAAGAWRAITC